MNPAPLLLGLLFFSSLKTGAHAEDAPLPPLPTLLWQPVQNYTAHSVPEPIDPEARHRVNEFLDYTAMGGDYGYLGPGETNIVWHGGRVLVRMPPFAWGGMWHSLSRLASMPHEVLDFTRPFPAWIAPRFQPKIAGLAVEIGGHGTLKLEIKGPRQELLWQRNLPIDADSETIVRVAIDAEALKGAKFMNWVAEPGSDLRLDSIGFDVRPPPRAFDEWVLASCYAKASLCFTPDTGMSRDRAHLGDGDFDSIPATGLFLLATAAASKTGMVEADWARQALASSWTTVSSLRGPAGLLPHFASRQGGQYAIHPGTEYSTVDTALYLHGALLAAEIMESQDIAKSIRAFVRKIDFSSLRNAEGFLSHGILDDGQTRIPSTWREWGGETALVLLTERMASDPAASAPPAKMDSSGKVWQGIGFIGELQSLFYPDFDRDAPDKLTGVNWRVARLALLQQQQSYFMRKQQAGGFARAHGFYSLSAGENQYGTGYSVNGSEMPDRHILHPHYALMSAGLAENPTTIYQLLGRMQERGLFPPCGLVENFTDQGKTHLDMIGALNAGFEAISAYHLFARTRHRPDVIHEAAKSNPDCVRAMSLFY